MMSIEKATKILALAILDADEAFSLFGKNAGSVVNQSNLLPLARDVAEECKGLPLALETVGRSLRGETDELMWKGSLSQLRQSADSAPVNIPGYLEDVFQPLKLSYNHLESDEARYLFLLCCLFPEDSKIEIENLVRYGVGLRIFSATESINAARNRVHYLVKMLISRCLLIDAGENPWPTYVKMHDVIRDMALYIASRGKHVFMVSHDKGLGEWPGNDSGEDYTCISLTPGEALAFPECIRCPKLNALLLTFDSSTRASKLPVNFFNEMANLRILSIQHKFGDVSFLSPLKNLRALHLNIFNPDNIYLIGQLVSLEILSCRRSGIRVLPNEIGELVKLKLLDLTGSRHLRNVAPGVISKLVKLEELRLMGCPIEWEGEEEGKRRSNASLAEVFSLRNLRFLEIWIRDSKVISQETDRLQNLTSYFIFIGKSDEIFKLAGSYTDLKRMQVHVNESNVSLNTISMLSRDVEELCLEGNGSKALIDPLARQGFKSIKHLEIKGLDSVKHLAPGGVIFPVLRHLDLMEMNDLEEICDGPPSVGSFSQLEYLSLYDLGSLQYLWKSVSKKLCPSNLIEITILSCKNLKWVFPLSTVESLGRLERIMVYDCPMMEEVFKDETGVTTSNHIEFPRLNRMILRRLPKLCALCEAVDVLFKFPSMETLEIGEVSTENILVKQLGRVTCSNLSNLNLRGLGMEKICRGVQISMFTKLEVLEISSFDSLRTLFSLDIFRDLINLRELTVSRCLMLEGIVKVEENEDEGQRNRTSKIIIPKLEKLYLLELPKIRYFCSFNNALELPSLEEVEIKECPMMETFALNLSCSSSKSNSSIPRFFLSKQVTCPQLELLTLRKLKGCCQLFSHEIPIASLGTLREVEVEFCDNLKSLFSARTFGGLTNLVCLEVKDCLLLEEVIAKEDVDDEGGREMKEVVVRLSELRRLRLENLPKLRGFSHMHEDLEFPSLEEISMLNCTEMKTSFSLGCGSVRMPKGVKVCGMGDPEFASKLFFKGEHRQDEDSLDNGCFMLLPSDLLLTRDSNEVPSVVKGSRMAGTSSFTTTSSKGTKHSRRWVPEEDTILVSCLLDLRICGTYNADNGFKPGYLGELERNMAKVLPNANIKGKPHIESRLRTLKKDWGIVYDMINGTNTSGFGWDEHRKMVTADDPVWESYLAAHPNAAQFRLRSFPYYNELTAIFAKDHTTGKDSQTAADIIEELASENDVNEEIETESNYVGQTEFSLDDMDISTAPSMSGQKRKRPIEASEPISSESLVKAAKVMSDNIREVGEKLSRSIGSEMVIQDKVQELHSMLAEIEGLSEDEREIALSKIPDYPNQMLVFCSLPFNRKLAWVRRFLANH